MSNTAIGWIGLGKMGIPMSANLIKAGYPVTVYNRTKEKEAALIAKGATIASTPAVLIQQSEVIVIMVSDDAAVRALFTGSEGLLSVAVTGKTIINMSTVSPGVNREMARLCKEKGHHYLDAPVSGSVKQAEDAQLVIMAGGEVAVFEQVKPILDGMGKLSLRVGELGAGNNAKLAVNMLLGVYTQALAEATVFAKEHGIEAKDLFTVINNSALGSVFAKIKGDAILNNNYQAAFALKHIVKDLKLAKEEGLHTPLGTVACETFDQAAPLLGEEDLIAIIKYISQS